MTPACLVHGLAALCLTIACAACGSGAGTEGGEAPGPEPTSTPAGTSATPTPTTMPPEPTPTGPQVIAPMRIPGRVAHSVNQLGWIAVDGTSLRVPRPRSGALVLAPDAGPDATPPPVVGCVREGLDGSCAEHDVPVEVSDAGWVGALREGLGPDGWSTLPPVVYGPDGESVLLIHPREAADGYYGNIHVGPGPLFTGTLRIATGEGRFVALVWREAGRRHERLDATGFPDGVHPYASDAAGWIVGMGAGDSGEVPVLWRPRDEDWVVERLPLPPESTRGSAGDVDGGRIVGWIDDGESTRAVVWTDRGAQLELASLPLPPGAAACTSANAISGSRITGRCEDAAGVESAVVWRIADDGAWRVEALLAGFEPGDRPSATDISGDLVVGGCVRPVEHTVLAAAWRLPPLAAR